MVITVSKVKTFEPEFNGNKDLPATERIVVKYKNPTVAMRARLIARPEVKSHADNDGKLGGIDIVMGEINKAAALREMLVSISGCAYTDENETEHSINNAKELMEAPSEFNELTDEIVKKFEEELNKKVDEKLQIAFRAYKEGIYKHEYKGRRAEVLWNTHVKDEEGKEIFIKRSEIKGYLDEYFWSALNIYFMTENMSCLPFAGGWAEQPDEITTVIALFRVEQSKWEAEEWEKTKNKK